MAPCCSKASTCPFSTSLLMAASAATCLTAYQVWRWSEQKKRNKKYDVPSEIRCSSPLYAQVAAAIDLALQAGSNMVAYCDEKGTQAEAAHDLGIELKASPEDFCTKIDVENERLVTDGILKEFPSHRIIGEEATGTGDIAPLTKDPTWIIDPIDGTTNFAAGLPLTCVSIGYCENGKPVMGVVYAPMTHELYVAVDGVGAFRNGIKITKRSNTKLKDALVCFELGYPRDKASVTKMVGAVQRLMEHGCRASRQIGSGVLDLCYVATGRLDVVYAGLAGEGWKPWDFCAGCVIVKEAGCCIEAIDQEPNMTEFDLYSKSHICGVSKDLVQEVRAVISDSKYR